MTRLLLTATTLTLLVLSVACTAPSGGGAELTGQGCVTSGNCGGSPCVPVGGTERVCTAHCVSDVDCATGWSCQEFGGVGDVCRCDREPELCDGDDDDCDGAVDEECTAGGCGDGVCAGPEDCASCTEDCGECAAGGCGDLVCDDGESCSTCEPDCGECVVECGDGICDVDDETCESCPGDCGLCMPVCGDGVCDESESCDSCSDDCGPCCSDGGEEPNDTEGEAARQGRPAPWGCVYEDSFGGVLSGSDDEDWFSVPSSDTRAGGCTHSVRTDTPGVSLCLFAACATTPDPDSFGCAEGAETMSPDGKLGCCTTAGPAALELVCTEGAGTATSFYVQVGGAAATECLAYEVTFSGTSP
jgi:hypothetical protein